VQSFDCRDITLGSLFDCRDITLGRLSVVEISHWAVFDCADITLSNLSFLKDFTIYTLLQISH
jgi:hypothetical protein